MVTEYTRAGRKKLWFDLAADMAPLDDDVLVLDDGAWDRFYAATGGRAAACFQCGVCTATCPWGLVKPEPVMIRHLMREAQLGVPGWTEALWLCTTCGRCTGECPRGVDIPEVILGLRSLAWQERQVPAGFPTLMWNVYWQGNPYGRPPSQRSGWLKGLDVHEFSADDEVLLYFGCTANYDRRIQKVARAVMQILSAAGVRFGALLDREPCCGDDARAAGQTEYADAIAADGAQLFRELGVKTVVAISPHCLDQFVHHFSMGDDFRAVHYTEYLCGLMEQGRLRIDGELPIRVTFHDPCYLGRRTGDFDSPRHVLNAIPGVDLVEMPHNRAEALCCGGGGGRMWLETPASERFAELRVAEARDTGAEVIATACPHCISCLEDSAAAERSLRVADVAELVAGALTQQAPAMIGATP